MVKNHMAVIYSDLKLLNDLSYQIIGAAYKVHRELGPGLLESSYEVCLEYELSLAGFHVERQKILPVTYSGVQLNAGYRIDLLIENQIILEIKSVDEIIPIHKAQLMTYLKLSRLKLGLLLNFNVPDMKAGLKRILM
jgi:GxxExxY protein